MTDTEEPGFLLRMILDKLDSLDQKLSNHITDTGTRVAVLEHRLTKANADIEELKAARKTSAATRLAIGLAVFSAISSPVLALIIK